MGFHKKQFITPWRHLGHLHGVTFIVFVVNGQTYTIIHPLSIFFI